MRNVLSDYLLTKLSKYQLIEFRGTIFYVILNFDFCTSKKLLYLIGDIRSRTVPFVLNLGAT